MDHFVGKVTMKRLPGLFLYKDVKVAQSVQIIMGNGFEDLKHRYQKNMDI